MIFWSIEDLATTTTARDTSAEGLKCASRKLHSCTCHIEIQTLIEATELCYGIDRLQDNIIDVIIKQWSELWIWKCRWVLSYWESCETRHVIIKLWSELWFGNAIQYHTENPVKRDTVKLYLVFECSVYLRSTFYVTKTNALYYITYSPTVILCAKVSVTQAW